MMNFIIATVCRLLSRAELTLSAFAADQSGSDTTEKVGMVVVAVIIVGLLAAAVNRFMPNLFSTIFGAAETHLNDLFT